MRKRELCSHDGSEESERTLLSSPNPRPILLGIRQTPRAARPPVVHTHWEHKQLDIASALSMSVVKVSKISR